jgi:heterodisulfide reductase subunit A
MAERIGVYICECGPNIKEAVDVSELAAYVQGLENVVSVKVVNLLCSATGGEFLRQDIQEHGLSRVVIAACSPKEHEVTFEKALQNAGLNPFLLQVANIREQCAWIIKDKRAATQKAKAMIKAAVNRVIHHEPLEVKEIDCQTDVLVVGSGITGLSAALTLAQKNRKVYLVEKLAWIGGRVARYEKVFPKLECASCVLDPPLDEILHHNHIDLMANCEVEELTGFYGNFIVKVRKKARLVDLRACIGCGACFEACSVKVKNEFNENMNERRAIYIPYAGALPAVAAIDMKNCLRSKGDACEACQKACPFGAIHYDEKDQLVELKVGAIVLAAGFDLFDARKAPQYGYGKAENVLSAFEFERMLNSTGPTAGKILMKNGHPPKTLAFIHCVGSRVKKFNEHCSGVCCSYLLKFAHMAKEKLPKVLIHGFYSDLCLPGKEAQAFCDKVSGKKGIELLRMYAPDSIKITLKNNKVSLRYVDASGKNKNTTADMVVLAPAMEGPEDAKELAKLFDIALGKGGFFVEENNQLAPVSTTTEGVFIAGCCAGPKDIPASVAQGQAAAGRILLRLVLGEKLTISPKVAVVESELCSGCKMCLNLCPYKAINYDEKEKQCIVNEVLCRGCGVCVAACPSSAIKARHFTDKQISSEIKGLLE